MSTEAYSKRMAVHVRRELRQANATRFAGLLAYYQVRGGPSLALTTRHHLNYLPARLRWTT